MQAPLALGVDLGSSGARLALLEPGGSCLAEEACGYPGPFVDPRSWREALRLLCTRLNPQQRARTAAIAVAGTSGTLLLCRRDGSPLEGEAGQALPYHRSCPEQAARARELAGAGAGASPAASASGSLARALRLLALADQCGQGPGPWLLRHQADWLMGWLLGHWAWGEEGNNLRLGWDLRQQHWIGAVGLQPWSRSLPRIAASGAVLGELGAVAAANLGLPPHCRVVAGSTDANAAVLAADPAPSDGITVLGTTLVLKQFCPQPIEGPGISCHRVGGRWLVGGASNTGCGVLGRFFDPAQLQELSRQIDPARPSGLALLPLPGRGERFPSDDPELEPRLEPRPISDALYLQALLEGLAEIEAQGWQTLRHHGAPGIERVISLGGGARNPQWRAIREQRLGLPVLNRPGLSAALGMARLAAAALPQP